MLLEVLLALGIFSVGIMSLAICLDRTIEIVNANRRHAAIRQELQTRLDDLRQSSLSVGVQKENDDALGVKYVHEVSLLQIENDEKTLLNNLYDVKVTASWRENNQEQTDTAEIYVYQP